MDRAHTYKITLEWSGNRGIGTADYQAYGRDYVVSAPGKPDIVGSSDPAFRGDPACWSPEDLLVASVSACHQLWYLHLCAEGGIAVLSYRDDAEGVMVEHSGGAGHFTQIILRPRITIRREDDVDRAARFHHEAHSKCFIANSVNFPIVCEPEITAGRPD